MLDIISNGFERARQRFTGKATLSRESLTAALDDVRTSLLEADVEYSIAKSFVERVAAKLEGEIVQLTTASGRMRVSPTDHFVKACHDQLIELMGPVDTDLKLSTQRPATLMMVGLQGSGKTTTTGKLTKYLIEKKKRKPLLVAADIYRPAAVEQLKVLAQRLSVPVFSLDYAKPPEICRAAMAKAYELGCDVVLFDTAGRLAIDEQLMKELSDIKSATNPDHIFFVCDAMMGQDAVTTAKVFDERLNLSGVIMTKLDGDARGGAALSIKEVLGKPIKFLGTGEDLGKIEEFRPEGLASRILGMGDVVGLMEDFERVADEDQEEQALKMMKGQFSFTDFYNQISMIQKMGSLKDLVAKLPMQGLIPKGLDLDDRELIKIKSMIDSMTKTERIKPSLFNRTRIERIAKGSGRSTTDVSELIKRFTQMQKMMASLGKNMGMLGKIPGMGGISQMAQLGKMAMAGGGGSMGGGLGNLAQMFGGGGAGMDQGPSATKKKVDRDKLKKQKKAARKAKKKNRR